MHVVFIGPSGAGKGTQAKRLATALGVAHLSSGDMLRAAMKDKTSIGQRVDPFMKAGQLVPDDIILELIVEHLDQAQSKPGYVLDGFPRTIAQAEAFDQISSQRMAPLHLVLELSVPDEELLARLAGRGRADDTAKIIPQRLVEYHVETEPLLDYYGRRGILKTVDGTGSIDEVEGRIRSVVEPYRKLISSRH